MQKFVNRMGITQHGTANMGIAIQNEFGKMAIAFTGETDIVLNINIVLSQIRVFDYLQIHIRFKFGYVIAINELMFTKP